MGISEANTFEFHTTSNLIIIYCKNRLILKLLNQLILCQFFLSKRVLLIEAEKFEKTSCAYPILSNLANKANVATSLNA